MAWLPYQFRVGLRQLRAMRTATPERRGRPVRYDDVAYIKIYVEIEAHARVYARGKILKMLQLTSTRLCEDGTTRRLNGQDHSRLRKLYQTGKSEAERWQATKFNGRPHPQWFDIQRRIEARVEELRHSRGPLLFPKIS